MVQLRSLLALLLAWTIQSTTAIDVDWGDENSVKSAASTIAAGMMTYYSGNKYGQTPGILPGPYYWWEAGAMWGAMIDYWHYTGDTKYNDLTTQALQWQIGPHSDFMPPNASASLGNDDQAFWGMAALAAAEYKYPDPPLPSQPSWLSLAQAVFNEQIGRWDTQFCGGGVRWQIYQITGWDLKNSISNGCLFNIAARLARYTGDDHYAQWAEKVWDWMWVIGLIDNEVYNVYDNAEADRLNCSKIDKTQWSYNAATMLMGASTMWNYTQSDIWRNRTTNLLSTLAYDYFPGGIMKDICEENNACNVDQHSFKAYLSRWLAATTQMAPFTYATIAPLMLSSAKAAAAQCNGSPGGSVCGLKWYNNGTWDGTAGVGQQMAALEVVLGTMVGHATAAVTNTTGGTSVSNPTAGYNSSNLPPGAQVTPATKADRAGAWFLTVLFSLAALYMWYFMNTSSHEWRNAATIGGKTGKKGRTVSTIDLGTSSGAAGIVMAGANGAYNEKRSSNVLTKNQAPDHRHSTGVFPSDRDRGHTRSKSGVSEREARHQSLRSMPPIVERSQRHSVVRDHGDRRSHRASRSVGGGGEAGDRRSVPIYRGGDLPT